METLLKLVPVLIGAVMFLGAASLYLKGSRDKGTIETLNRNNDALQKRVDLLEKSEAELKTRVEHLESENVVLKGIVTSSDAIVAVHEALDTHHTQAMAVWSTLHVDLGEIKEALSR